MSQREQSEVVVFGGHTRLTIVCVALAFLLPTIFGFFTNHKARQNWEKRELASLPDVMQAASPKDFFADLEAFIDDHIGFATPLNRVYRQLQFYVFSDSPVANVDVGDDGFVFLNSHSVSRPYSVYSKLCIPKEAQVVKAERAMVDLANALGSQGFNVSYAIVPSKALLYPAKIPRTVPAKFRKACKSLDPRDSAAGQLRARASETKIAVYFPFEELAALRNQPAFYPPGNFHAASMLNHEFAKGLLSTLGIDVGPNYAKGVHLGERGADLRIIGFSRKTKVWSYPYSDYGLVSKRHQPAWVKRHYPKARDFGVFTSATPASDRTALLLSNSFGNYMAPHLAPGFKSLHHINLNELGRASAAKFFRQVLDRVQPDEIIFLVHDAALPYRPINTLAELNF